MKRTAVQISGHLMKQAKIYSEVENRSMAKQIEHWIKLGKCAEENDDLPLSVIKEMLTSMKELDEGQGSEYKFDD